MCVVIKFVAAGRALSNQQSPSTRDEFRTPRQSPLHDDESLKVSTTITAPAEAVFAVLSDPVNHPAIDGTGWVTKALDTAPLTGSGQTFRMAMYHANHPDGSYEMINRVEVLDPPHAIAWEPGQDAEGDGNLQFGGWIWRYDLVAAGPSGTEVTLTYDWSTVPAYLREYIKFPPFPVEHLTNSLHHLAELATGRSCHPELAGPVVAGGLPHDDVHPVEGVDEGDQRPPGRRAGPRRSAWRRSAQASSVTPPAASAMRVPCSASSRAARSASVKTVASRQAATRLRRTAVSPACAASLVCMSVQNPQPLIWLARIFTSSCVATGSVDSETAFPAAMRASGAWRRPGCRRGSGGHPWWAPPSSVCVHLLDGTARRDVTRRPGRVRPLGHRVGGGRTQEEGEEKGRQGGGGSWPPPKPSTTGPTSWC